MRTDLRSELATLSQSLAAQGRNGSDERLNLALAQVAAALRGLDEAGRNLSGRHGWWGRLSGRPLPIEAYLRALDRAALAVDELGLALRAEAARLAAAHRSLEALQGQARRLEQGLDEEIAGVEAQLAIPAAAPADRTLREDGERRLHDLALTRRVLGQTVLSIASMQAAHGLVSGRVEGLLRHVLPAWEEQTGRLLALARKAPGQGLPPEGVERLQAGSAALLAALTSGLGSGATP